MSVDMVELEVFKLADDGEEESGPGLGWTSPEHNSKIHSHVRDTKQAKWCVLFVTNLNKSTITFPGEMNKIIYMMPVGSNYYVWLVCCLL